MTEIEEIPIEYVGLIIEEQLLDHLATPEGATAIWQERLHPDCLPEGEEIRDALIFVLDYMDEHRAPPDVAIISEETRFEEFNEPIAPVEYVIAKLRERQQRRELKKVTTKIGRLVEQPEEAIRYGIDALGDLRQTSTSKKGTITTQDLHGTLDDYLARQEGNLTGVTFGFKELDDYVGGLKVGELSVVIARPKRYKSWLLLKSNAEALLQKTNTAFATMELSETETRDRLHCMLAGVSWPKFKSHTLRQEDVQYMAEIADQYEESLNKTVLFRPKMGDRTVGYLLAQAIEAEAEVLYIDQLSWFDGAKDERAWAKIGSIMEELKDAAQVMPIYMAAQFNREAQAIDGLADIAKIGLSDMVGQSADNIFAIYASEDMLNNEPKIIHFGLQESRSYEKKAWEIKVELSQHSNFKFLQELT